MPNPVVGLPHLRSSQAAIDLTVMEEVSSEAAH
jgi:hypothetical protein